MFKNYHTQESLSIKSYLKSWKIFHFNAKPAAYIEIWALPDVLKKKGI